LTVPWAPENPGCLIVGNKNVLGELLYCFFFRGPKSNEPQSGGSPHRIAIVCHEPDGHAQEVGAPPRHGPHVRLLSLVEALVSRRHLPPPSASAASPSASVSRAQSTACLRRHGHRVPATCRPLKVSQGLASGMKMNPTQSHRVPPPPPDKLREQSYPPQTLSYPE